MSSALDRALSRTRSVYGAAYDLAVKAKASGGGFSGFDAGGGFGGMDTFQQQAGNRQRYNVYRGWVHSAINALAMRAAQQPVLVGQMSGQGKSKKKPNGAKALANVLAKMPASVRLKSPAQELEINPDHELVPWLEHPNAMQHRIQFVYSFVANMCLTGWGFVAAGQSKDKTTDKQQKKEDKIDFFGLPTSWVKPDHADGAFSRFYIVNPNNPTAEGADTPLDRSQVAFAQFPNPADPLGALSLTQAQNAAIQIDDKIQTSQTAFFDNGIFPGAVVTVGSNPHPAFPAGVRPRLNANQRRQIYAAIAKLQAGVQNYGRPAIVDGLIEKIERLTMTNNEMGWDKSEKSVKPRILSAFGVHGFMLGEEMAGSYAQAYMVERIFCSRVNFFLDMLSTLMTGLCRSQMEDDSLVVWWELAEALDPNLDFQIWNSARGRNDVTKDEFRHYMGLPPDENESDAEIDKVLVQSVVTIAAQVASGAIQPEQGQAILEGVGVSAELAKKIAGPGHTAEGVQQPQPTEQQALAQAADAVDKAVAYLTESPLLIAKQVLTGL